MSGILITPELVKHCIAKTWSERIVNSDVKQAQVICILRAAGYIDAADLMDRLVASDRRV